MRWLHRHRFREVFHFEPAPEGCGGWLHDCRIYQFRVHEVRTCRCGEIRESYSYANGVHTSEVQF